jgi:hypothetical protein
MNWIKKLLSGAVGRLIRSTVSLLLGILLAKYKDNPWFIAAAPLLQAISKWGRAKYPAELGWLPF